MRGEEKWGAISFRETRLFNRLRRHFPARAKRELSLGQARVAGRDDASDPKLRPEQVRESGVASRPLDGSAGTSARGAGLIDLDTWESPAALEQK